MFSGDKNNSTSSPSGILNFFLHLGQAKRTYRSGWILRNVKKPESIADHMYRMSMMSFLAPAHLDRNKCIEMCLVHDLAESIVGDFTPDDKVDKQTKLKLEQDAMKTLSNFVSATNIEQAEHLKKLFDAYEAQDCPEARFVKSLDLFDMYLQAYEYEQLNPGVNLGEFLSSADKHPFESPVKEWVRELVDLRNSNSASVLPSDSNLNTIIKFFLNKN